MRRGQCRMDPIVSPTGQRVLSHPGSIAIWTMLAAKCVFSGVRACTLVYFPASVNVRVRADVSPRQLLFFGCSSPSSM